MYPVFEFKTGEEMISVDEALSIILSSITPLEKETVSLWEASGRFIFEDIHSDIDIPGFNNSAMDGYAVRSLDTAGAGLSNPVVLRLTGEIQAGAYPPPGILNRNCAIRIMTGAPIPEGADAVIPFEDTEENEEKVKIQKSLSLNENIRMAGEDIKSGQKVLRKGERINPASTGILASLNIAGIDVFRQPRVAIISTGDEIAEVGEEFSSGKIRNSNAYTLYTEIQMHQSIPDYLGITGDSIEKTRDIFTRALNHDVIISTGGISMGRYDFIKEVVRDLEIIVQIETIKMKPGKPFVFGTRDKTLFFGLPGNPVSTMISFIQFVRPALLALMGARRLRLPEINAVLDEDIRKKPERRHFIRGFFTVKNGTIHVTTTGPQGSGILRSMGEANCLIIIPEGVSAVSAGETVTIQLFNHDEIE